jgi:hypothetical protein
VDVEIKKGSSVKNSLWSESIAVGTECFIKNIQDKLAGRAVGCSVVSHNGTTALKEPQSSYNSLSTGKKGLLSHKNTYFLQTSFFELKVLAWSDPGSMKLLSKNHYKTSPFTIGATFSAKKV